MKISDIKQFKTEERTPLIMDVDAKLTDAMKEMASGRYGAVVVYKKHKYAGLVTERSVLRDVLAHGQDLSHLTLGDVLRPDAPTAMDGDDAQEKLEALNGSDYRHMPILDRNNEFVGMLSQGDFAAFTWSDAMRNAAEITKVEMSKKYQPFIIAAAAVLYSVIVTIYAFSNGAA